MGIFWGTFWELSQNLQKAYYYSMKEQFVKLAIFDIDGTIFRSSLLVELIRMLVEKGVFPAKAEKEIKKEYLAWLDRKGTYENYIHKVIHIHIKYIKGCSMTEVDKVATAVIKTQKDRVYRFTRDLIKQLKKQRYHLLAISGSPLYIVSKFANVAGFQAAFGSEYETKDGYFTGKVMSIDSVRDKDKVLYNYLIKNNLRADLKKSFAIGDTESDVQMLSIVGKPIAFNPNLHLGRAAIKHNWRIVVERKDIMYDLKEFNFLNK